MFFGVLGVAFFRVVDELVPAFEVLGVVFAEVFWGVFAGVFLVVLFLVFAGVFRDVFDWVLVFFVGFFAADFCLLGLAVLDFPKLVFETFND